MSFSVVPTRHPRLFLYSWINMVVCGHSGQKILWFSRGLGLFDAQLSMTINTPEIECYNLTKVVRPKECSVTSVSRIPNPSHYALSYQTPISSHSPSRSTNASTPPTQVQETYQISKYDPIYLTCTTLTSHPVRAKTRRNKNAAPSRYLGRFSRAHWLGFGRYDVWQVRYYDGASW